MFRKMRRAKQELSHERTVEVLNRCTAATLALIGDDGYPYSVPISYVYDDGKLFFHSAAAGHKVDAIKNEEKVSFSVIDKDEIIKEKYTTYFRSVIGFGKARILEDPQEKIDALMKLGTKYSPEPEFKPGMVEEINDSLKRVCVVEITIDHMTGKEAIELIKQGRTD